MSAEYQGGCEHKYGFLVYKSAFFVIYLFKGHTSTTGKRPDDQDHSYYSLLKLFTGLVSAAFRLW